MPLGWQRQNGRRSPRAAAPAPAAGVRRWRRRRRGVRAHRVDVADKGLAGAAEELGEGLGAGGRGGEVVGGAARLRGGVAAGRMSEGAVRGP